MLAVAPPSGIIEVITWPFGLTALGLLVFFLGLKLEHDDGPAWVKWLAVLPLLAALYIGYGWFSKFSDSGSIGEMYREFAPGGRMKMAHYAVFGLPLLGLLGIVAWAINDRRNR